MAPPQAVPNFESNRPAMLRSALEALLADVPGHRSSFLWGGGPAWEALAPLPPRLLCSVSPPRSTFLRARDRSIRTQLRSPERPWGLDPAHPRVSEDNEVARSVAAFAGWLAGLCHVCVVQHPADSYLWRVLDDCMGVSVGSDYDLT